MPNPGTTRANRAILLLAVLALAVTAALAQSFLPSGLGVGPQPGMGGAAPQAPGPRWYVPSAQTGAAIQAAINAAFRDGARVYLPGGTYSITQTMDFTHLGPVLIEGEAMAPTDGWRGRGGVELKWTGAAGGTMFRLNAMDVQFKNVTLNGNNLARTGIQIFTAPGWGSALDLFQNMLFVNFTGAAFQAGEAATDHSSADLFFDRCMFNRSDTGFRVVHNQGVNYHFNGCYFLELKTGIQSDFGGAIHVTGGGGGGCDTFIRTGEGGHNTGPITVRDFRMENGGYTRKWGQVLDCPDSGGGVRVLFDGFHMAGGGGGKADPDTQIFNVGSNVTVHVRDSVLKTPGQWTFAKVNGKDYPATLWLENCDADADLTKPSAIVHNEHGKVQMTQGGR